MKKNGIAIPLVLIFATILGLVSTFILKSSQQYNKSNQTSFAQLQSYFVARAGVEHAMIKIKYLHRELYDAICMSQGRNPLFDFSLIKNEATPEAAIKTYNPGPIFLYKSGNYTPTGVFTPGFNNQNKDLWLNTFMSDLTSISASNPNIGPDGQTINATIDFANLNDIKALMGEPFQQANYRVSQLNVAASEVTEGARVENNAIVELVIESSILTARDEPYDYVIKKTVKVSRD